MISTQKVQKIRKARHTNLPQTLKLRVIGSNQTELHLGNGTVIFFSYDEPVAAVIDGDLIRTDKRWSATTQRHISQWLNGRTAQTVPQSEMDNLLIVQLL